VGSTLGVKNEYFSHEDNPATAAIKINATNIRLILVNF
jgi:hypothetical protein